MQGLASGRVRERRESRTRAWPNQPSPRGPASATRNVSSWALLDQLACFQNASFPRASPASLAHQSCCGGTEYWSSSSSRHRPCETWGDGRSAFESGDRDLPSMLLSARSPRFTAIRVVACSGPFPADHCPQNGRPRASRAIIAGFARFGGPWSSSSLWLLVDRNCVCKS